MKHYYYYVWMVDIGEGYRKYHTGTVTDRDFRQFLSDVRPTKYFEIIEFDSLEELNTHLDVVGLCPLKDMTPLV